MKQFLIVFLFANTQTKDSQSKEFLFVQGFFFFILHSCTSHLSESPMLVVIVHPFRAKVVATTNTHGRDDIFGGAGMNTDQENSWRDCSLYHRGFIFLFLSCKTQFCPTKNATTQLSFFLHLGQNTLWDFKCCRSQWLHLLPGTQFPFIVFLSMELDVLMNICLLCMNIFFILYI